MNPDLMRLMKALAIFTGIGTCIFIYFLFIQPKTNTPPPFVAATPTPTLTSSPSPKEETTMCTMDAMQCSDGTWVGRSGPKCQFVCPK